MEKQVKTRIIHKHATAAEWAASSLIPYEGELIIYDETPVRFKIGDGYNFVKNLDFVNLVDEISKFEAWNCTDVSYDAHGIRALYDGTIRNSKSTALVDPCFDTTIPIVAGKNISFETDTENNVVKINAASTSSEMPQIRFVSGKVNNTSGIITETDPLILNVEINGGGPLQVGDQLQVCVRRTTWKKHKNVETGIVRHTKRQKLRCMLQHTVQEEDLNNNFLQLLIPYNEQVEQWLFRNDQCSRHLARKPDETLRFGVHTLSPIYIRIRRNSSQEGESKSTVMFSNVETVWKTYDYVSHKIAIK